MTQRKMFRSVCAAVNGCVVLGTERFTDIDGSSERIPLRGDVHEKNSLSRRGSSDHGDSYTFGITSKTG